LMLGMLASFSPSMIAGWQESGNSLADTALAQWLLNGGWVTASMLCLLVGFILGQLGNQNMRRFMRSPRSDQVVARALKGFDDRNKLYVWATPVDLVFAGPAGVYTITTRDLDGEITIANDRVRQPFRWRRFFAFGQEPGGQPALEAQQMAEKLRRWLAEKLGPDAQFEVKPLVVFTNDKARLQVQSASAPVVHHKNLKQHLRKELRNQRINKDVLTAIIEQLDSEAERRGAVSE
ncbi:MAG: hypothetical protein D6791_12120, partial [Chloroflexi bacterium]